MSRLLSKPLLALTISLALAGSSPAAGAFVLVAHPGVKAKSLSRADVSRLFLKKTTNWPGGVAVVPVDQPAASRTREAFSRDVHGRSAAAVDAYWQKLVFSGSGVPPTTLASDEEVLRFVRTTPGGVGYVSLGTDTHEVSIVDIAD